MTEEEIKVIAIDQPFTYEQIKGLHDLLKPENQTRLCLLTALRYSQVMFEKILGVRSDYLVSIADDLLEPYKQPLTCQ